MNPSGAALTCSCFLVMANLCSLLKRHGASNMNTFVKLLLVSTSLIGFGLSAQAQTEDDVSLDPPTCISDTMSLEEAEDLAQNGFAIPEDVSVDALALEFSDCIGELDPFLRDEIGYTGLSKLLRDGMVEQSTLRQLLEYFSTELQTSSSDFWGIKKPFAALNLSEVVRVDRVSPYLSDEERVAVVETTSNYLRSIRDYRGFSDEDGWRHGVAHAADLVLQLVLNDQITPSQIALLIEAVVSQVPASNGHGYVFGEYDRLARPVIYAALSGKVPDVEWERLFDILSRPEPLESWQDAFKSKDALGRLHNTKLFAYSLMATLEGQERAELVSLREHAKMLASELP